MRAEISRRDFLWLCGVLSACASFTKKTEIASSFVVDPSIDDYRAPLRALIETVLPVGSPDFPLAIADVESRLLRMFPLEHERRFLGLQRTLMFFERLDLAPHVAAPLLAAERIALDVPARMSEESFSAACAEKTAIESRRCSPFARLGRFSQLDADHRLEWFRVWASSEFTVKRDFAQTFRQIAYVSAYSSDAMWRVINYEGPLVAGTERTA